MSSALERDTAGTEKTSVGPSLSRYTGIFPWPQYSLLDVSITNGRLQLNSDA
jgi:hypothetical protein